MEYWITLKFATGSVQEYRVTGITETLRRTSQIINACASVGVMLIECNIKVIQ
jgi:hypothetical protein